MSSFRIRGRACAAADFAVCTRGYWEKRIGLLWAGAKAPAFFVVRWCLREIATAQAPRNDMDESACTRRARWSRPTGSSGSACTRRVERRRSAAFFIRRGVAGLLDQLPGERLYRCPLGFIEIRKRCDQPLLDRIALPGQHRSETVCNLLVTA